MFGMRYGWKILGRNLNLFRDFDIQVEFHASVITKGADIYFAAGIV